MENQRYDYSAISFLLSLYKDFKQGFTSLRFLPLEKNLFLRLSETDTVPSILKAYEDQNAYIGIATKEIKT